MKKKVCLRNWEPSQTQWVKRVLNQSTQNLKCDFQEITIIIWFTTWSNRAFFHSTSSRQALYFPYLPTLTKLSVFFHIFFLFYLLMAKKINKRSNLWPLNSFFRINPLSRDFLFLNEFDICCAPQWVEKNLILSFSKQPWVTEIIEENWKVSNSPSGPQNRNFKNVMMQKVKLMFSGPVNQNLTFENKLKVQNLKLRKSWKTAIKLHFFSCSTWT